MKFEKPVISITKFDTINCLEGSSTDVPGSMEKAVNYAEQQAAGNANAKAITITF